MFQILNDNKRGIWNELGTERLFSQSLRIAVSILLVNITDIDSTKVACGL